MWASRRVSAHIFERFRQADAGTTRKHGGLGLGLAITRHLVQIARGNIEAASDGLGKGTTFSVSLPIMIVHGTGLPGAALGVDANAAAASSIPNLHGIRILVVDDDGDALALVREILETTGAEVATVDSAKGALQYVETARPDVLIADLGMPEMDGSSSELRRARNTAVTTSGGRSHAYALGRSRQALAPDSRCISPSRSIPASSCRLPARAASRTSRYSGKSRTLKPPSRVHWTRRVCIGDGAFRVNERLR